MQSWGLMFSLQHLCKKAVKGGVTHAWCNNTEQGGTKRTLGPASHTTEPKSVNSGFWERPWLKNKEGTQHQPLASTCTHVCTPARVCMHIHTPHHTSSFTRDEKSRKFPTVFHTTGELITKWWRLWARPGTPGLSVQLTVPLVSLRMIVN